MDGCLAGVAGCQESRRKSWAVDAWGPLGIRCFASMRHWVGLLMVQCIHSWIRVE